jgi:Ca-activated chloride channel homolog
MFRQLLVFAFLMAACMPNGQTQVSTARPLIETIKGEQAIELQSLKIESNISGGLAETTVRMTFYNPNNRVLEGNLQFPLLDGQQITAFALDMNGKMRQAVPVEKAKGRQVFEAIERRGVDPGLLENTQGNNFKLRIYPIAARGVRTVELRYSEPLKRQQSDWLYTLPMGFGNNLKDFELSLKANGINRAPKVVGSFSELQFKRNARRFEAVVSRNNFSPTGTLTLQIPASDKAQTYTQAFDGQNYFIAEVPVADTRQDRALPSVMGLLWDSSGSGDKRNHDLEFSLLERYFKKAGNVEVRLTRLRDRAEATETYRIKNGDWSVLEMNLENTVYDGASALSEWKVQKDVGEYLLFSDGLSNYGNKPFPRLANTQRLYAINSATSADTIRLTALAEQSGGRYIPLQSASLAQASQSLLSEGVHLESLNGEGVTDLEFSSRDPQDGLLRVAGRLLNQNAKLAIVLSQGGKKTTLDLSIDNDAAEHPLAANLWASYRLRSLDANHEINRAAIRRIGESFGLPTRETSLIVLDTVADYVRYEITPPEELRAEYAQSIGQRDQGRKTSRDQQLNKIVSMFDEKYAWWNKVFPKNLPKQNKSEPMPTVAMASPPPAPSPVMQEAFAADAAAADSAPTDAREQSRSLDAVAVTGSRISNPENEAGATNTGSGNSTISLKKWTADAPYIARMKAASNGTIYAIYLDEKPGYNNSSAFFLDAADMLLEKNQPDLALRVLSNLAEMDLENRQVLRILGYRLIQAGAPELAIPVFEKVQQLAEEEPQSFRDLGLAYAAAGQNQKAIEQLYEVVLRPWDGRFAEIELIALAELNSIIATSKQKLDTTNMDARLLKHMPLDLRVILTWDADNSDMDLWVTDPNGEKCFYGNKATYQGGRMSDDFTGGYGPEEFSLRNAKPGKYKIETNFFGNRQQVVAGATTLQVYLTTGFGTLRAKQQSVTLRLKDTQETVFVGEFEVKP